MAECDVVRFAAEPLPLPLEGGGAGGGLDGGDVAGGGDGGPEPPNVSRMAPTAIFSLMKMLGMRALTRVPPLATALATSRDHLNRHLDTLEAQLEASGGPWLLGQGYTLADVSWLVIFERLRQADSLHVFCNIESRPLCVAYWYRLCNRRSYRAAILDFSHPLIDYGTRRIRQIKDNDAAMRVLLEGA